MSRQFQKTAAYSSYSFIPTSQSNTVPYCILQQSSTSTNVLQNGAKSLTLKRDTSLCIFAKASEDSFGFGSGRFIRYSGRGVKTVPFGD